MGLRAQPINFRARGVTDAIDETGLMDGAMKALVNLIPNPNNLGQWIPRPASVSLSSFAGFNTPLVASVMLVVGEYVWGMIPSSRFAGKDEPFCYDIVNGVFITIANLSAGNLPNTQLTTGDWTPPTMKMITNGRIMITHPGYDGVNTFVGWLDISAANLTGVTGDTHTSTLIDNLSSNPINAGWQVGMKIAGVNIPANTYIKSLTANSVTLTQATTGSTVGVAITVTGGSQAAPLYGAGNLNTNALVGVATCVAGFNSRAWYAYRNYVVYSDTLNPTQVTNANQALQIGDNIPVNALAGLPLTSQVNGGTLQSLIVFKGAGAFTQITGDAATGNLVVNQVAGSVGTMAPNSICATPLGLAFVSADGLRILGLDGVVKPAIGTKGRGVSTPFTNAQSPSRICAAYNQHVIRITVQDPRQAGDPYLEYWYDLELDIWTGPHTFPNALIQPYYGDQVGPFIHFGVGINGKMWNSYSEPNLNATYTENGAALNFTWSTPLLPDNQAAAMNCMTSQGTLACQLPEGEALTILMTDENGAVLDTVTVNGPPAAGAHNWGAFNWGAGNWGFGVKPFQQVPLNWSQPNVFKQCAAQITGPCMGGLIIGDLHAQIQKLEYMVQ